MHSRRSLRLAVYAALFCAAIVSLQGQTTHTRGRKYKAPPPVSRVDVTIVRAEDDSPVENASVIFQLVGDKGNMELKTDEDGKTFIDVLPTGSKFMLQVLAKGYQTFGQSYDLDVKKMAIEVKLNRPGKQYSIYDKHPDAPRTGGTATVEQGKPANANPDAKPAENDKQADGTQKDSAPKPDTTQPK